MTEQATNRYPSWSPRIWHGMTTPDYLRLLFRNRLAMHPSRWPLTFLAGSFTVLNSVLFVGQRIVYGRKIDSTQIDQPPIFIIGHWRTGTTMLHEMFAQDEQFVCPSTYECFVPNHFLISERVLSPLIRIVLPRRRPMDNMAMGLNLPQEDEFALCAMGAPTSYFRLAFPNRGGVQQELLDMNRADTEVTERCLNCLERFMKALTIRHPGKRLVMKSPPHTGRIEKLVERFPGAKFIHLSRHPDQVFPSTMKLWKSLDFAQGLQVPKYSDEELQAYVFDCYQRMYGGYFEQRTKIPAADLVEIRYEDLVKDPLSQVAQVYEKLGLQNFDGVHGFLTKYHEERKGYKADQVVVDANIRQSLRERWSDYFERFGYD
ncbi:sulfotransferase [Vicingaceae bacterium]|nr:sulfotransferase [Vicingaceae bacterium]